MANGLITSWQIDGEKVETVTDFIFLASKITVYGECSQEIKRYLLLGRKAMTNLDSILKNRDMTLPTKVHLVKVMVFPVVMYRCESQLSNQKNWWFGILVLKKTLQSLWDSKDIKPVNPKGIFTGRTDAEVEALILWPHDVKNWLIGKDPDAGKDWRQKKKGAAENEMVGWHHWLSGHEFVQTLRDSEGQRRLACCSPWSHKELDMT